MKRMLPQLARAEFERLNRYSGDGLPNHCRRMGALTLALAAAQDTPVDEELVWAGAWLHDIGLLVSGDTSQETYLQRGLRHCAPLMDRWGVHGEARKTLTDMLLYNHSLRPVTGIAPAAELMRQAVRVEHSNGLLRAGLSRAVIQRVFMDHPRDNFTHVLADFTRITVLGDGAGTLPAIFFP